MAPSVVAAAFRLRAQAEACGYTGPRMECVVLEQLWAPWRAAYVTAPKPPGAGDACFLCRVPAETNDRENLVIRRLPKTVVVLNRYPYNAGHLLVAPRAHKASLEELDADEVLEIHQALADMKARLDKLMRPEGYNAGVNLGTAGGAGLPGHLHWHLVPRWNGDTNFMPILGDAKVIVASLDALWQLLANEGTTHA